ncbi:MAG: DUF5309 family protein [Actinobacteria bacterium]|nr:DUF5309 family protein [Actinomycetota bacterium]
MANPTLTGVVSDATIAQAQRVVDMNPVIQNLQDDVSQFTNYLQKIKSRPAHSQIVQWLEDDLVPIIDTLAVSAAVATGGTSTLTFTSNPFRVRDVLRFSTSGENVVVTGITGVSAGVNRALSLQGTTAAAGSDVIKIGNAALEGATLGTLIQTKKIAQSNYCQIQRDPFGFTETALASEMYGGNLDTNEKAEKFIEHRRQLENTAFFGQRAYDSSGTQPVAYAGGAIDYIATNKTTSVSTLDQKTFETFLRSAFRYGGTNKVLFCSPLIASALSSFPLAKLAPADNEKQRSWGTNVNSYISGSVAGRVDIVVKRDWMDAQTASGNNVSSPAGMAFLIDTDAVKWRPLRDTRYLPGRQGNDEDSKKNEYLTEGCIEFDNEKRHALLLGVTAYS